MRNTGKSTKEGSSDSLFISHEEAAKALGVSVQSVRAWIAAGWLPSVKWGRHRKIPRDALVEFRRRVVDLSVEGMKLPPENGC